MNLEAINQETKWALIVNVLEWALSIQQTNQEPTLKAQSEAWPLTPFKIHIVGFKFITHF